MRACTSLITSQTLAMMLGLSVFACHSPAREPTPVPLAREHAGTYRVTVERGHYSYSGPNPLEGVLVLQPGRLPSAVLDRLPGTYFTARDSRLAAGEACVRWEEPSINPRTGYPRRRLYATAWRSSGDTLELMLRHSLYVRYTWSLVVQPDGRLIGVGEWASPYLSIYPLPRTDSITAVRIGDAMPTECLPDPESRTAAEPFPDAPGTVSRRTKG